ncbi:roquin-2 isoform X1 [Astyanax mexicanus]|uniref:roquin-2 isoform X1 n=1 Tax=Astyanax mexicanus TaxID=7994 RepID=UPI0020CB38EA|nr:roquin-2 isoform X1 [Astyanax mexicanus]XP_022536676.2 roquin-2 isoform X1 [Astyanax mexicanus]
MPVQAAQWTEFLSCPICYNEFDASNHKPISLGCSHTVCKTCLHKLHRKACPFDQTSISTDIDLLPVNCALLLLVGAQVPEGQSVCVGSSEDTEHYDVCRTCVEELALYLKPISGGKGVVSLSPSTLSRPMQRKLVTLVNCQLVEEEGRTRAVRAARSLGERTVTELILQHQNPTQLSANLWAAVRARGCQFLGPAMQEDALKLVLLALEDGSALSRKVLVLFVVQKLEARFPQASKTSIGHVVQLLYRASCFKVTKRDEDSSLMQLKEEFRTYEALRREHDAQIVHIAMEAGLRISPEQWSSLLYGDLVHKSHMQSIIDKLQSPESFAKSVQELTIVLQRTGDPANLNSLRAPLELLAALDHNPDAAAPSWEELENVMLGVKVVVHGLVEFIQNFSKKSHEAFQSQPNSKYKTSMCRDLRQQGSCPRGANCTFAHTQDELEKYRMRNKKVVGGARPSPVPQVSVLLNSGSVNPSLCSVDGVPVCLQNLESEEPCSEESSPTRLVPRGGEPEHEDGLLNRPNGASGLPAASQDQKTASPPKTPASPNQTPVVLGPHPAAAPAESEAAPPKRVQFPHRAHPEVYFPDQRSPYDLPPCPASSNYYSSMVNPHKSCMTRFSRSSPAFDSSAPPPLAPPYLEPPPSIPSRDRLGPSHFPPAYSPIHHPHPHAHGVYAPVYDSRRVWRPQLYHRQDGRSNSLPPEVLHSSIYQPPLRERFNSLDSPYCSAADRRAALHRESYGRAALGCEDFYRLKQEQWTHQHSNHNRAQPSPVCTVDLCPEHVESGGCVSCKCGGGEVSRYTPWSRGSVGPFDSEPIGSAHSCSQHAVSHEVEGAGKHWLHIFEPYRRVKEEDPIIPFGEGPIISKWGAISRASRTEYHTTEPVQATAAQSRTSTTPINFRDYGSHMEQGECRWGPCGFDSSRSSFLESERRRSSFSSAAKRGVELLVRDGTESEPDRDIELELSALDLEEPEPPEHQPEVSLEVRSGTHLSSVFSDPAASSQPNPQLPDHMLDSHLLKKMAFRKSLCSGGLNGGNLVMKSSSVRLSDPTGGSPGQEMLLNGR